MALNDKYVPLASLFTYFVNKETSLPLKYGYLEFYSDVNRSQLKAIYELSGSPPNYSYTQLENPLFLSGVGTFIDENDALIIPYGYPYDAQGNPENYYIKIYDANGVLQGDVEAWPNITGGSSGSDTEQPFNFIPNGQFWAHNDIPEDEINKIPAGQIRENITEIAPGNWTFERTDGSTSTDKVTFFEFGQYVENPSASPRYACRVQCLGSDPSDTYKYLKVSFPNVNQFSSDTQEYTFFFNAITFNSGNFSVDLDIIKNYGTGGSPSTTENIELTTFNITNLQTSFQFSFKFGSNSGKQIGTDFLSDSVDLVLSFPTNISFGADFTDFGLFLGAITVNNFPQITVKDTAVRSIAPQIPDFNGNDLFLPLVNGPNGLIYDDSIIGRVEASFEKFTTSLSATSNLMLLDGSQYLVNGYSDLGIPFKRLWNKILFNQTTLQPIFGTGDNFITSFSEGAIGSSPSLFLFNNKSGVVSSPANGTASPGITFSNIHIGTASDAFFNSYLCDTPGQITLIAKNRGFVSPVIDASTTGFSFVTLINGSSSQTKLVQLWLLDSILPSTLAGKYVRFRSINNSSVLVQFYMWFTVDGAGSDPGGPGTSIKVDLKSTFTQTDLANIICYAMSGAESNFLTFPAASTITAGDYFTFQTGSGDVYSIYYKVDGVGNEPTIVSTLNLEVDISSTDTADMVAQKTMTVLNSTYFRIENAEGLFLRGIDPNKILDLDAETRFNVPGGTSGILPGTLQYSVYGEHHHQALVAPGTGSAFDAIVVEGTNNVVYLDSLIGEAGFFETRPSNISVTLAIRY